jgi:hypothetical protein
VFGTIKKYWLLFKINDQFFQDFRERLCKKDVDGISVHGSTAHQPLDLASVANSWQNVPASPAEKFSG